MTCCWSSNLRVENHNILLSGQTNSCHVKKDDNDKNSVNHNDDDVDENFQFFNMAEFHEKLNYDDDH
ncbi:hypothetical protein DERF_005103 [Dermatophagoides farinae]|uniref:Uncharacterized protein n=1 Tax=Dermatophagoides farinae TaxID=6954 RepID=A0A922I572_DERFA|nr:hypothetical protein DERF_005103 [Dermatophagoides farinae]